MDIASSTNNGEEDHVVLEPTVTAVNQQNPGLVPAHTTTRSNDNSNIEPVLDLPVTPEIPRRSTRNRNPSQALLRSCESDKDEDLAAREGRDWATNSVAPEAFNTSIAPSLAPLPEPNNYWLPNLYSEAMSRPDIWEGPINKELAIMKERGVWEIMDPPTEVCTIGTR